MENKIFWNRIGNRWTILTLAVALATLLSGCFEEKLQVYNVGILSGTDDFLVIAEGFKAGMAELGYTEGENIIYDLVRTNAEPEKEMVTAEKFVQDGVDLIFTFPTEPTVTAQGATQDEKIPIVFAYAGIEGAGLVNSVREPGGNITGVRFPGPEQMVKRLEILRQIMPDAERVWACYDKNYPTAQPALEAMRPIAKSLGMTLIEVPVSTIPEMVADLEARAAADDPSIDAMILMPDTFNHSPAGWGAISQFAAENKIPLCGSFLYTVEGGSIFGNANDLFEVGKLAATSADKILRGTPPGEIPVLTPEQELWINYKVVQDLGLTVPESLLGQAAEIVR
jgi:putative ABC transport system substrate-binding protein